MPLVEQSESRALGGTTHALRLVRGGLLAGMGAGAVAGLGARLAMLVVRLLNGSHNGEATHANAVVGRITAGGTLTLVIEGLFYGVPGAIVYLLVRRWLPGHGVRKGLAYGFFLLIVAGSTVLDGNYEFFRYVSTWVSVGLFALLFPLYGIVVAPLTERLGHGAQGPPHNPVVAWSGYVIIGAVLVRSIGRDYVMLRDVFHLFD